MLIIGVVAQFMFGFFQFMAVGFSAAGIANTKKIKNWQRAILNGAIYDLPLTSFITAGMLIYFYIEKPLLITNWWHLISVVLFTAYMVFATRINKE